MVGERHGIPFSLTSFHIVEEAHWMYSKDVGGGQQASLAFLWSPRPLWRCPPAPFTFEFLSRPSRSVVKYILKSYEFMNFAQVYLSPSPHHQGETCIVQRESCNLWERENNVLTLIFNTHTCIMLPGINFMYGRVYFHIRSPFKKRLIRVAITYEGWNKNDAQQLLHAADEACCFWCELN